MNPHPPKILPEDISEARAGKFGAFINAVGSGRKARCRQCFMPIESGDRITFATVYLPWPTTHAHLHADESQCLDNLANRRVAPKKSKYKKYKIEPNERSSWVLTGELLVRAYDTAIRDHRPRHRTTCRNCGGVIELHEERLAFKLRNDRGWEERDAEGRYVGQGFLHGDWSDCKNYEEAVEVAKAEGLTFGQLIGSN